MAAPLITGVVIRDKRFLRWVGETLEFRWLPSFVDHGHAVCVFQIDVHIYEPQGISFLDASGTFLTKELAETAKKTLTEDKAHVVFKPTLEQQRKCPDCSESILDGEFIIKYNVKRAASAGDIQIVNGYFVHYFAPADMPRMQKNVVFVIDRSGSMHGKKMQQTREALLKILRDIYEDDHFGIITFGSDIVTWKSTLVKATPNMLQRAKTFVENIQDQGDTDINAAVLKGVEFLKVSKEEKKLPEQSVSLIILLTDGDTTSAADQSSGPAESARLGFYEEVATPLLQQVELHYPDTAVSDLTERVFRHYYNGSEIVVAGPGGVIHSCGSLETLSEVQLPVSSSSDPHSGSFCSQSSRDLNLATTALVEEQDEAVNKQKYIFGEYIERLWAYLTIQQLLSKAISAQPEEQGALNGKALQLSLNYNFVTPLTSMVVTKPEEGEI
ncbi:UNVERIFIED_CONTAM: hypothetical protein FKN15_060274 [Acipenser sinensis]